MSAQGSTDPSLTKLLLFTLVGLSTLAVALWALVPAGKTHPAAVTLPAPTTTTTALVPATVPPLAVAPGHDPVVAAAGNIACGATNPVLRLGLTSASACAEARTADVIASMGVDAVLAVGDIQRGGRGAYDFAHVYDPTWGRFKAKTRPVPGHNEASPASGYFDYFGNLAGDPAHGYYSFDLGTWHLVALNSNCSGVGGCYSGSPQERWLRADLERHGARCTLAYWNGPLYSSTRRDQGDYATQSFWSDLEAANADVVVGGDAGSYERFAPQTRDGEVDATNGIREFVVGTGGVGFAPFPSVAPHSEIRNDTAFGVLALTLHPDGYDWRFAPVAGASFTDSGHGRCH